VWNRIRWFLDQLWGTIGLIRIASCFFDRLHNLFSEYVHIQYLWCRLDLLHYQLQAHHTLLSEHLDCEQIPVWLLDAFASTLEELAAQVKQWHEQLGDDLTFIQRANIAADGFCKVRYAELHK
jgi:hypothetical protein